ncbi:hypothetical protein [Agrobacterium sp. Ap1]|uniref:hypothetical protein n=1 Tax=Agrobacterium sp. Ap1 TaxID=2815337 RepID=UPI001A8CDB9F|nr:hypothetical protein [Agrobacterium sp. Ap1]
MSDVWLLSGFHNRVQDRRLPVACRSDSDMRDRGFIGRHGDGDFRAGAELGSSRLSGVMFIFGFDQQCLRYKIEWHVFL